MFSIATKAQLEGNKRYLQKLDEIRIRMPKGKKAVIQARAAELGKSVNQYINNMIDSDLEKLGQ